MFQHLLVNFHQVTLQEYNRTQIGRQPQLFGKWKTTLIFSKWKKTSIFKLIEDGLNYEVNGRQPQF